jgi:acyl-CoA synthetase (NDP forming)
VPIATYTDSPIDLTHAASPSHYESTVRAVLDDDGVDAVLAIFAPPLLARTEQVARAIAAAADASGKPVLAVVLGADARRGGVTSELPVPVFAFPEEAARALGRVAQYRVWLSEQEGRLPVLDDVEPDEASAVVERALEGTPTGAAVEMSRRDAVALLRSYRVELVPGRMVESVEDALVAADDIGFPVVLKAGGIERLRKSESGGLAVDLHSADEVRQSYDRMTAVLGDGMRPAIVQQMVSGGVDVAIRLVQHDAVGSVLSIGVGGVVIEQIAFDSLRFLPLTDLDADRLIGDSRLGALLPAGSASRAHLCEVLCRVGALADALPEVTDLMLNPVIVTDAGAAVTDGRISLTPVDLDDIGVRRLVDDL